MLEALLDRADVLVENFRPGTMADLGYPWDGGARRWPRLVQASVSGFGQTGPMSERPAYDMVVQALGGVMSITGPDGGEPTRVGTSIGDITAGLFAAHRHPRRAPRARRHGRGSLVDVAMLDCQVAILENAIARYVTTGVAPGPIGARHPSITPFGAFRAADGMVVLAAGNDRLFGRLCRVLGVPELAADPRFATNHARCEHEPSSGPRSRRALAPATVATWVERLEAADLPAAPINDVAAVLAHPQVPARTMVVPVDDPAAGLPGGRQPGEAVHPDRRLGRPPAARCRPRRHPHRAASSTERPQGRETAGIHFTAAHGRLGERRFLAAGSTRRGFVMRRTILVKGFAIGAVAVGAAAWALPALAGGPGAGPPGRVKHIVVIYEENHSFDNLYGLWGSVNGEPVNGVPQADSATRCRSARAARRTPACSRTT